jgi:hypothetical protein
MLDSRNASAIEHLSKLDSLSLAWKVDEPVNLQKLERLQDLAIFASPHLESVWKLGSLRILAVRYYRDSDLAVASRLDSVEKLSIGESKTFASLRGINELRKLHFLGLYGNNNLLNLASISEAPSLEYVVIEGCSRLECIGDVTELPSLKYLEVRDCPRLASVDAFPPHPHLTHVFFMGRTRPNRPIEEIVAALPNLKYYFCSGGSP